VFVAIACFASNRNDSLAGTGEFDERRGICAGTGFKCRFSAAQLFSAVTLVMAGYGKSCVVKPGDDHF
jgi:hypothetical protein